MSRDLAEKWQADGLILDEPRAGEAYQQALFEAGLPWLQFDGTAQKPLWASWVLNALPSANASDYGYPNNYCPKRTKNFAIHRLPLTEITNRRRVTVM